MEFRKDIKLITMTQNQIETLIREVDTLNETNSQLTIENNNFLDNLHYAQIIQDATLPKQRHLNRIFEDSFYIYKPKSIIGGDFFWCSETDKHIFLAVGDCTGHGVPGAMLATLGTSLLNYAILNKGLTRSAEILHEMDKRFVESFTSENDSKFSNDWMEIGLMIYNKKNRSIEYSGAKTSLFIARGMNVIEYKGNKFPIGGWQIETFRNYTSKIIPVRNEDYIYLSTDGFFDQIGGFNNKRFSRKGFKEELLLNYFKEGKDQKQSLLNEFSTWRGYNEQTDDVCVVGVKLSEQDS